MSDAECGNWEGSEEEQAEAEAEDGEGDGGQEDEDGKHTAHSSDTANHQAWNAILKNQRGGKKSMRRSSTRGKRKFSGGTGNAKAMHQVSADSISTSLLDESGAGSSPSGSKNESVSIRLRETVMCSLPVVLFAG